MLKFYDVDPAYANYLRQFDARVPNIIYSGNNKFACGVVLDINGRNYFAPIFSNKARQQTNILIRDEKGDILSSIKFSFMFPAPDGAVAVKNFNIIRTVDPSYADLLQKEYDFCKKNEQAVLSKAAKIYKIGCNPGHLLYKHCCNFPLLEAKYDDWVAASGGYD